MTADTTWTRISGYEDIKYEKSPEGIAEELVVIHIENPEWDPDYGSWPRTFPKGLLSRAAPF